ncbi:hypothetical protein GCM10009665_01280 [Kitasatospora nipponensis]|uniref:Uncharacterized protein n=1 Tax=Kitasatospora nipponensis TaxID=258049 RepID=A0ABP4GE43_9ACTN
MDQDVGQQFGHSQFRHFAELVLAPYPQLGPNHLANKAHRLGADDRECQAALAEKIDRRDRHGASQSASTAAIVAFCAQ